MPEKLTIPTMKDSSREVVRNFWEKILREFEDSAETLQKFSDARGLPVHQLVYWKGRLGCSRRKTYPEISNQVSPFMPVKLSEEIELAPVTIRIGKSSKITLDAHRDKNTLTLILSALAEV